MTLSDYLLRERRTGFDITDLSNGNSLFSQALFSIGGSNPGPRVFSFDVSSTTGLKLTILGEFFDVGVDNINYSATKIPDSTVIPLPAGAPLLLAGLGTLALMARRRRS